MKTEYDIVVAGGGPAGLAAALKAWDLGADKVALLDENEVLGGVLPQCIHTGFGIQYFKKDLTGPEFASKLTERLQSTGVEIYGGAYVAELDLKSSLEKEVIGFQYGEAFKIRGKALIYAAGCRERNRFEIWVMGDRPSGVYTAGEAQTLMDLYGVLLGRSAVIVGSGDVGLILARRLVLEGAKVKAVVEVQPYPGGLTRNVVQCLQDFSIPLLLCHAVTKVKGLKRVEAVELAKVDGNLDPVSGTEFEIKCDTLIVAAGLIPRCELLEKNGALMDPVTKGPVVNDHLETSLSGVFAAGNVLAVNDLVDYAAEQGETAAENAAKFVAEKGFPSARYSPVVLGRNVRLAVPQLVGGLNDTVFYGRVHAPEDDVKLMFHEAKKSFNLTKVRPSEMFRVKLFKKELSEVKGDKLTISVKKMKARERE